MSRSEKKPAAGATTPSQFRLGDEVLAKLDELVPAFAAESADAESRSSVVRKLINREHARRTKQKGK